MNGRGFTEEDERRELEKKCGLGGRMSNQTENKSKKEYECMNVLYCKGK